MDKRTRSFIAKGAAVLGLAAAGAAAYRNDEKLFALGIRRSFGKNDVKRDAGLKAPEHKFPDQLGDINSAMKFVCRTADEYRGDLDNVFFVGDSAGAQMASQYLAAVTNAKYAQLLGLDVPEFKVRAAALNCGMYELDPVRDKMLIKCYLGSEEVMRSAKMDVLANITGDYPPCFVMTSTGDFLRGHAEPMGALLTRRGVENEVHVYGTEEEPLGHVFHCDVRNPIAAVCNEEECEFFRRRIVK